MPGGGLERPACSYLVSPLTLTLQGVGDRRSRSCACCSPWTARAPTDRAPHHVLMLTAVTGALALAGARDLITLVVAFETASLPAIGLVALRRDAPGAQGAFTLLLTAVGSLGLLLMGIALLVLSTGSVHLDRIVAALPPTRTCRSCPARCGRSRCWERC